MHQRYYSAGKDVGLSSRFHQPVGNSIQNLWRVDVCGVESWRVDDDHCAAGGTVSEANRHDVRRLGLEGVADGDAGLAREEVDEL